MALLGAAAMLVVMAQSAAGNHFYPGYCTWAAADEAQRAWGLWLPWYGDAGDWPAAAADAGWRVSSTPQLQSIAAMPRNIQGSGPDGHVAWVIAISPDATTVTVRSMNWHGRGVITVHDLQIDGHVQFISPATPDQSPAPPGHLF